MRQETPPPSSHLERNSIDAERLRIIEEKREQGEQDETAVPFPPPGAERRGALLEGAH